MRRGNCLTKIQNNYLKEPQWATKEHRQLSNIKETKREENEKFNKEIETIKTNPTQILELKNIWLHWKKSIENFNSRLNQAKDRLNEHKTGQLKLPRQRKKKKSEKECRKPTGLYGYIIKRNNIHIWASQKEQRKTKGHKVYLKK